ncbi:MAG: hypothetical protein AAF198_11795 [Pseudomonadota bacterium]
MSSGIKYLEGVYPKLIPLFDAVGPLQPPVRHAMPLSEAVVNIVTGQMLSNIAAAAIVKRVRSAGQECGAHELFAIPEADLRRCGLSRRKIRSIKEFGVVFEDDPNRFAAWPELPYEDLRLEVRKHWGLSDWTAEMLAIFHFGHDDVFPSADGTIKRAVGLIECHLDPDFDPDFARPHRTTLARALWASIDRGFWNELSKPDQV